MLELRILRARSSHLHPGARLSLEGGTPEMAGPCLVEFAGGAAAAGSIALEEDGRIRLVTVPYRTAAGRAIPEKRWLLEPGTADEWRVIRHAELRHGL